MSHRRRDVPGGLGLSLGLRTGGPLLGGGALPSPVTSWKPIDGQALPAGYTFDRGSNTDAYYRNDSGVWVAAGAGAQRVAHNATVGGGSKGSLVEPQKVGRNAHVRDLTDAVWTKTTVTPALDAVGLDGVSNTATTLTATANNGTVLQGITRVSVAYTFSCFVSRKTGTGTVEITIDNGTTWVDITSNLTSTLDNQHHVTQTLANPTCGFRIGTSGDEIVVDCAELDDKPEPSSPMVEDIAGETFRGVESLDDGVSHAKNWAVFADATAVNEAGPDRPILGVPTNSGRSLRYLAAGFIQGINVSGGSFGDTNIGQQIGTRTKYVSSYDFDNSEGYIGITGNVQNQTSGYVEDWSLSSNVTEIGHKDANFWFGTIHEYQKFDRALTEDEANQLVG